MERARALSAAVLASWALLACGAARALDTTTRVSTDDAGVQAQGSSLGHAVSGNGRYVVFSSRASNLVPGDTNGVEDVFVKDRNSGTVTRVSVSSAGTQANGASSVATLNSNGRYVAFVSSASNLVPGDSNGHEDVFVHDRRTRTTTRVSISTTGTQANGASYLPALSADGRYVAFSSSASNLVPGDVNGSADVFVHNRNTRKTTRVNVSSTGEQADDITAQQVGLSADGRYVAFSSRASNLVPGDTNGLDDVFVRDRRTRTTTRVSVSTTGTQANGASYLPALSADGRYVAFASDAFNLVSGDTNGLDDVFVHDRSTRKTRRVNISTAGVQANGSSARVGGPIALSADGRYVAFNSLASNLVEGDTNGCQDVFLRDRQTRAPTISTDGNFVVFTSNASNLVAGDTNGSPDVFVRDRSTGP